MSHLATRLQSARTIELESVELPDAVPPGHVRLKLATASLCGTDLHYYRHFANAGFELQHPLTLGHEACATVVEPNGSEFFPGELLAINPIIFCGKCPACLRSEVNYCSAKGFPGSATTVPHIDGFFQRYFDFPAHCCHRVAASIRPEHLTFAEPLACAMHAVTISGAREGSTVLVSGCGPMGLLTVVAARAVGAHVTATDVRPDAVTLAQRVGADRGRVIDKQSTDDLSGHFDAVIEASGAPAAFNLALDLVRRQSVVCILSNIQLTSTPIELHRIMLKEIKVLGSFQFNAEFKEALALIASDTVDFDALTAARFPLEQAADAFELMLSGEAAGKILLVPDDEAVPA